MTAKQSGKEGNMKVKFLLARLLFDCLGEIDEIHIDEAEFLQVTKTEKRKSVLKYSAVTVTASVGIATAFWLIRYKSIVRNVA